MTNTGVRCGYLADGKTRQTQCPNAAVYRNVELARCKDHGGAHDYAERWNGSAWICAYDAAMEASSSAPTPTEGKTDG